MGFSGGHAVIGCKYLILFRVQIWTLLHFVQHDANASHRGDSNFHSLNLGNGISAEQAASMLGVSRANVVKAKAMLETATPDSIHLVNMPGSSLSLDAACLVATRPKEEQKEIVNEGIKQ